MFVHGLACLPHKSAIIICKGQYKSCIAATIQTEMIKRCCVNSYISHLLQCMFPCTKEDYPVTQYFQNKLTCASSAQYISRLLLVLPPALPPPHSLALVPDLARALGLQQLAVV